MRALPSVLALLFLPAMAAFAAGGSKSDAGESATVSSLLWLGMVDEGKYSESWEQAADNFRGAVGKMQWQRTLEGVRKPLGKTIVRKAKTPDHHTSLPGAPDGEYYVIQFNTEFENKKEAVETVTVMLGKDGLWRVSGYFIK